MSPPALAEAALAAMRRVVAEHGLVPRGLIHAGDADPALEARWRALGFAPVLFLDPRARPPDALVADARDCNVLLVDLADLRHAMAARALAAFERLDAILTIAMPPRRLAEIDRALFDRGLVRLAGEDAAPVLVYLRSALTRTPHATGGRGRAVVTMSHFGHNAGFANQLFQYAFLKLYGLRNNCAVETPPWIGEEVYGVPGRRIARPLPEYRGDEWSVRDLALWDRDNPPVNVDFWGYYQNIPARWRPHRAFVRRLFTPLPPWRAPVERWLAAHRPPGRTLVALHLRRGDYRDYAAAKPWFRLIPEEWYLQWLAALWPTLADPVLFIASDDRASVLPRFAAYRPLTAEALEAELPEPRLLADFQILAAADVLAVCNSSFSRMAAVLAGERQNCFIAAPAAESFVPYDPWTADHFWQRFGAPRATERRRLRLPRWLRKPVAL